MFVELVYGFWTNSLGLISDAFHMLFDSTALAIGLYASVISKWEPNRIFTYGYGRVEVLSGFINGIFLCFIAFSIFIKSIERLIQPQEVSTEKLLLVSVLGLCVNLVGIVAFHGAHSHGGGHGHSHGAKKKEDDHADGHAHNDKHHGHHGHKEEEEEHSENLYAIFLHILADTLGSVGVIISSLLIDWYGWLIVDPICSLCISLAIFF